VSTTTPSTTATPTAATPVKQNDDIITIPGYVPAEIPKTSISPIKQIVPTASHSTKPLDAIKGIGGSNQITSSILE